MHWQNRLCVSVDLDVPDDTLVQLLMAAGLVQMVGLFHPSAEERAVANIFHGTVVMVRLAYQHNDMHLCSDR